MCASESMSMDMYFFAFAYTSAKMRSAFMITIRVVQARMRTVSRHSNTWTHTIAHVYTKHTSTHMLFRLPMVELDMNIGFPDSANFNCLRREA